MVNNWSNNNQLFNFDYLLQRLFKRHCLLCASPTRNQLNLCQPCVAHLPRAPQPRCPQCALPTQGEICGKCLKEKPYYDQTIALFSYAFPVDTILQQYKYHHALHLSKTLAQLFIDSTLQHAFDVIIPMPLHPSRLKERGFNQSLEVAKIIAKSTNIPIDYSSCSRIKNTPPQASLPFKARLTNMRGAFQVDPAITTSQIKGKRIAIVDDVMTTGASLNELAKTLKKAGATRVECWVIARTLPR